MMGWFLESNVNAQTEVRKETTRVKYDEIDATYHEIFLIFKKKCQRKGKRGKDRRK